MFNFDIFNTYFISTDVLPGLFLENAPVFSHQAVLVFDAVLLEQENKRFIRLYFPHYVNMNLFIENAKFFLDGNEVNHSLAIMPGGTYLDLPAPSGTPKLSLKINATQIDLAYSEPQYSYFSDRNAAILVSNGDRLETIAQWLEYYTQHQELNAAIIIRRNTPEQNDIKFAKRLEKQFGKNDDLMHLTLIQTKAPLGKNEPSERELYMAPDAPGKALMEEPKHDPWRAQLANSQFLEILRDRFLLDARAVLFLHPSDLLPRRSTQTVFDETVSADGDYLQLFGARVFPWRVRSHNKPDFTDHVCKRFDDHSLHRAWCVVPKGKTFGKAWNLYRIGAGGKIPDLDFLFWRCMALRHDDPDDTNPTLAPKTSLVRDELLIEHMTTVIGGNPVMPPKPMEDKAVHAKETGPRLIVTTMKDEGPFILEWIAYHKAIGFDDFIVYSNDCSDGTDIFLDLLDKKGIIEHRQNPYKEVGLRPQHAALFDVPKSKRFKKADWIICMDCDEYVNIHVGDGTLDALFETIGAANMISFTWRLIGNSGVVEFEDKPIIEQFFQAAPEIMRFPHQAWGVKTLYRNLGYFKKMGVHRPNGLRPECLPSIKWVNGSGKEMPQNFIRSGWRTGLGSYGYDLVSLNHYAVRSMHSFLVKRNRGRVNHVDRDQGLHYWLRMNHNVVEENSIKAHFGKLHTELEALKSDPEIAAQHQACVDAHRQKIDELLGSEAYDQFFNEINSDRMRSLSALTDKLGNNVFIQGPEVIPDRVIPELATGKRKYFNVRPDGTPFD